jgi:hypothetical protein
VLGLRRINIRLERAVGLGVLAYAIAVAADIDQVAVMQDRVDERGGHDVVAAA